MPRVEVRELSKAFGSTRAVWRVSFAAGDGQFTTLLGPSGCGKTTTLRLVAGFEEPDEGSVAIGDRVVCAAGGPAVPPERRRIGMVFQSYALWPHMTVAQNIAFPLACQRFPKKEIRERTERVLELVRMRPLAGRYPAQLSGGQQQRVALARALAYDPVVLLLDEPLANLDAKLREEMRLELRRLQGETGITTLYVTHDQVEAMVLSDQLVLMNEGEVVQAGSAHELYSKPANEFAANFLGLSNLLPGRVAAPGPLEGEGLGWVETEGGERLACALASQGEGGEAVLLCIRPEDIALHRARPEGPNVFEGEVRASSYLGETSDIWVATSRTTFRVRAKPSGEIRAGVRLFLSIEPGAVKVLPRRDAG